MTKATASCSRRMATAEHETGQRPPIGGRANRLLLGQQTSVLFLAMAWEVSKGKASPIPWRVLFITIYLNLLYIDYKKKKRTELFPST